MDYFLLANLVLTASLVVLIINHMIIQPLQAELKLYKSKYQLLKYANDTPNPNLEK